MSVRDASIGEGTSATPRLVLDTNVCLDLFVFDDARCAGLHRALLAAQITAVTDEACREEWRRVLTYPVLKLDECMRIAAQTRFDTLVLALPMAGDDVSDDPPQAPRCRDPHDQKFLDLAIRAGARWLLSRDDHLLSLARRARRDGLFEILTPEAWLAAHAASAPP
ncbi:putative toxin-antitoxin system toxin component, PIN family [Lysobacter terrae]